MKRAATISLAAIAIVAALPLGALELRVHPGKEIYLYEVDARRGLSSAIVQNLALVQGDGAAVTAEELTIDLTAAGSVRQTLRYGGDDLAKAAARMAALEGAGMLALYDFAFQPKRYLGETTKLASSATIAPGTALVITSIPMLVPRGVDAMRITAKGTSADGRPVEASLELPLRPYKQANDYRFPLRGSWITVVGPGFSEPHRWVMIEEFAIDVVKTGASGGTCKGDCSKLADYYAWGEPVLAAADGVVVAAVSDQPESNDRLRQPGESADAFMQRTMDEQGKLLAKGAAGVGGNHVVIKHEGGEYSHYAHLAAGSVSVKAGDRVKRGQPIGKLGHTGNSTEPHLHFTVADGPDPLYARSLPVRFSGLTTVDGPQPPAYVQSGWLVKAE